MREKIIIWRKTQI